MIMTGHWGLHGGRRGAAAGKGRAASKANACASSIVCLAALPACSFVDIHAEISSIRLHKTPEELALQRKAIRISEDALEATLGEIKVGMTEAEVESILLRNLFSHGADGLAFAPIVAAGDNAARPHAHARPDYRIKPGDALLFDFGGSYHGYSADITRTFFVKEVSDYDRAFYETVLAANAKGREVSRAGITASDVDDAVQKVLEQSQFVESRRHKTGHSTCTKRCRSCAAACGAGTGEVTIELGLYRSASRCCMKTMWW
jgi:Xaa-Pro dipeptidase